MLLALLILLTPRYLPVGNLVDTEYTVDATSDDGSILMGRLYERSSLPGSGRGSRPHLYAVCEAVTWDGTTGEVLAHYDLWRDSGTTVRGAASCFQ